MNKKWKIVMCSAEWRESGWHHCYVHISSL